MATHQFFSHLTNQSLIFIGGAPQELIDSLNFLQEMNPKVEKMRKIGGFRGCISDIYLLDEPVLLINATKVQNIDIC